MCGGELSDLQPPAAIPLWLRPPVFVGYADACIGTRASAISVCVLAVGRAEAATHAESCAISGDAKYTGAVANRAARPHPLVRSLVITAWGIRVSVLTIGSACGHIAGISTRSSVSPGFVTTTKCEWRSRIHPELGRLTCVHAPGLPTRRTTACHWQAARISMSRLPFAWVVALVTCWQSEVRCWLPW